MSSSKSNCLECFQKWYENITKLPIFTEMMRKDNEYTNFYRNDTKTLRLHQYLPTWYGNIMNIPIFTEMIRKYYGNTSINRNARKYYEYTNIYRNATKRLRIHQYLPTKILRKYQYLPMMRNNCEIPNFFWNYTKKYENGKNFPFSIALRNYYSSYQYLRFFLESFI